MRKLLAVFAILPALLLVQGCGGSSKPTGKITGTVTLNNEPLDVGEVKALSQDGKQWDSVLVKNGQYTLEKAPVGEVNIIFSVPGLDPSELMLGAEKGKIQDAGGFDKQAMQDAIKKFGKDKKIGSAADRLAGLTDAQKAQVEKLKGIGIMRYMDPKQSGLKTSVTLGQSTTYNINLK